MIGAPKTGPYRKVGGCIMLIIKEKTYYETKMIFLAASSIYAVSST